MKLMKLSAVSRTRAVAAPATEARGSLDGAAGIGMRIAGGESECFEIGLWPPCLTLRQLSRNGSGSFETSELEPESMYAFAGCQSEMPGRCAPSVVAYRNGRFDYGPGYRCTLLDVVWRSSCCFAEATRGSQSRDIEEAKKLALLVGREE